MSGPNTTPLPHYILISNSAFPSTVGQPGPFLAGPPVSSLFHPATIHYHYADDPPLQLMPLANQTTSSDPVVLILEHQVGSHLESNHGSPPLASSLSSTAVVTGVRVTDAPGAHVADHSGESPGSEMIDGKMYVIDLATSASHRR